MLTLCCSENHQEICYEGIACPLCKAMEDVEDLKIESLKPCVTCDVFNENERLKEEYGEATDTIQDMIDMLKDTKKRLEKSHCPHAIAAGAWLEQALKGE